MNWKNYLCTGAAVGAILAISIILLLIIPGDFIFESFPIVVISFLTIILISPYLVRKICSEKFDFNPSLKHLIPVSFLTFLMPILGASFGMPNFDIYSLAMLVALGMAGGTFWSLPLILKSSLNSKSLATEQE